MLERASAKNGKAPRSGAAAEGHWQPLTLPEVPPAHVQALTAFYRRRQFAKAQVGGRPLAFAPRWQSELPEIAEPWTLSLRIDDKPAEIVLPETLLRFLLREVEASVTFESLSPDHRALILELALADMLEMMETALGCAISIANVRRAVESRPPQADTPLLIGFELQNVDRSWCILRAGDALVHRIARGLDRIAPAPAPGNVVDLTIPARLRWGSVDLTLAELKSLRAGDIVLFETCCHDPDTALAVIGDHLMAPVKVLPKGYQLIDMPRRIAGSGVEWCGERLPMQTGPLRDAQPKDLPVRLFVELAHFGMSFAELKELVRGVQFGAENQRKPYMDLVVKGTTIGAGELTSLGIGLGVRIARI